MITEKAVITQLNYLCRTYDGISRLVASTKNRLQAINPGKYKMSIDLKGVRPDKSYKSEKDTKKRLATIEKNMEKVMAMDELQLMEWTKDKASRDITKDLKNWDIWTQWLEDVPGIGPFIAGNLILFYYYRFLPICQDCGGDLEKREVIDKKTDKKINRFVCSSCNKTAKGEGVLDHRIDFKDFARPSSWWHYLGMHNNGDGVKPKRAAGVLCSWSTKGRTIGYQIGDQFNRQSSDHPYKAHLLKMKKKHERKNGNGDRDKEWTKGHIHNAAKNEAAKLFLSHFWHVARTLEGLDTEPGPYIKQIEGHTVIPPFFWESGQEGTV